VGIEGAEGARGGAGWWAPEGCCWDNVVGEKWGQGRAALPVGKVCGGQREMAKERVGLGGEGGHGGMERVMLATPTPYYEGAAQALPSGEVGRG
jgi:hypothetical protein